MTQGGVHAHAAYLRRDGVGGDEGRFGMKVGSIWYEILQMGEGAEPALQVWMLGWCDGGGWSSLRNAVWCLWAREVTLGRCGRRRDRPFGRWRPI